MKEFVLELLQAVATAAVPVCAAFLVQFLRRKSEQIGAQVDSLTTKELLAEVTEAITTAVTYTSQTYVDALKKNGIFDKAAQLEALEKSKEKTLALLSASAKDILAEIYGDLDAYLETKIEAEVRAQKQQGDVITLGEPYSAELKEAPDVTSVAAATAAATAAAVVQTTVSQASPVGGADSPVEGGEAPAMLNSRPRPKHRPTGRETGGNRHGSGPPRVTPSEKAPLQVRPCKGALFSCSIFKVPM